MSQGFSFPITSLFEFQRLNGASFVLVGHTGGLWFGATTGQSQGVSLNAYSATTSIQLGSFPHYQIVGQGSPITYSFQNRNITQNYKDIPTLRWASSATTIITTSPMSHSTNVISNTPLVNQEFTANGQNFLRFDGSTFWTANYINPHVLGSGAQVLNTPSITVGIGMASFGMYRFYASYVNNRGFESEIFPALYLDFGNSSFGSSATSVSVIASLNGSFVEAYSDLYTPSAYGISAINIYSFFGPTTALEPRPDTDANFWYPPYIFLRSVPASGGETTRVYMGCTLVDGTTQLSLAGMAQNIGAIPDGALVDRLAFGLSYNSQSQIFSYENYNPKFISSNNNMIFASGFSAVKSTVFFSDIGEPQGYNLENSIEVRTNDGDEITGQVSYGSKTIFFKRNSFHVCIGDNANNISVSEGSLVYGCLNNRSYCLFEDVLAFLDRKGIVLYNGAKPEIISQRVQPIFDRMNYSAAINTACMVNDKLRNQILCAIPVDGSAVNNLTVVFDYLAKAWTTYDGFYPTVFAEIQGRNNTKNVFYGTSIGVVNWFGPSFFSDNGVGATTYLKSRFLKDMGDSVQKQFRRFYLNVEADASATYIIPVNFFQDYGTSKVLQTTMTIGEFQNRIDFGISAKSLAFEIANIQNNSPLKIYGFTIESRLQRRV